MNFSTNHDESDNHKEYAFHIYEDLGENKGVNTAEIGVWIDGFIDSRTELSIEIKRKTLEFLKRAVSNLESELKD
ncbi:hypothetical protein F018LOC_00900 [Pectobacterium versatile]|uniref:hypothetical protein n=1 Tax=Pectobacterium versatile TaxID=2488639 RepID=UPI000CDEE128|nr:hypothetical protein [Pectobacterium versatile]POY56958.1 hypothetical protein F018LOC_00900 [Pectobacterium versatile]